MAMVDLSFIKNKNLLSVELSPQFQYLKPPLTKVYFSGYEKAGKFLIGKYFLNLFIYL